jgi:hypothetical protein
MKAALKSPVQTNFCLAPAKHNDVRKVPRSKLGVVMKDSFWREKFPQTTVLTFFLTILSPAEFLPGFNPKILFIGKYSASCKSAALASTKPSFAVSALYSDNAA